MPTIVCTLQLLPSLKVKKVLGVVEAAIIKAHAIDRKLLETAGSMSSSSFVEASELENGAEMLIKRLEEKAEKIGATHVLGTKISLKKLPEGVVLIYAYGTAVVAEIEQAYQ